MKFKELHRLIHNLSEDEHVATEGIFQQKGSSYHQLYELLRALPLPYEEAQVELFCQEHGLDDKTQRTYRNRLRNRICSLLLDRKIKNNALHQLQEQMNKARIFFDKECYDQAEKELHKAANMESAIGHPASRREINSLLARKLYHDNTRNIDKKLNGFHQTVEEAAKDFLEQSTINLIYQRLFRFGMRKKDSETQKEWEALTRELEKIPFPSRGSVAIQVDYVTAWIKITHRNADLEALSNWAKRGIQIFDDKPILRSQHPRSYVTVLDHYLGVAAQAEDFAKMWELIPLLRDVTTDEPLVISKKEAALIFYELTIYCYDPGSRRQLDLAHLEDLRIRFDLYSERFLDSRTITTNYMFSHLYVLLQNYPNAEQYADRFNLNASELRRADLNRVVLLIKMLITVMDERQNSSEHQMHQLKAAKETLRNWRKDEEANQKEEEKEEAAETPKKSDYEGTILRNLKRLIDCPPMKKEQVEVFERFREELQADSIEDYNIKQVGVQLFLQWLDEILDSELA